MYMRKNCYILSLLTVLLIDISLTGNVALQNQRKNKNVMNLFNFSNYTGAEWTLISTAKMTKSANGDHIS